jgi:GAF domain-containing protein/ActR/RegA family two-component response regulator
LGTLALALGLALWLVAAGNVGGALAVLAVTAAGGWLVNRIDARRRGLESATATVIEHERSRLDTEITRRTVRLRTLAETGRLLVSNLDRQGIVDVATSQCLEGLDLEFAQVYLLDEAYEELHLAAAVPPKIGRWHLPVLKAGEGVSGRALVEGRPVWSADPLRDASIWFRPESRSWLEARGTYALLAVPFARQQTVGALVVYRPAGMAFSADEIDFVSILASHVAVALENARLFAEADARLRETRAMLEVAQVLSSTLEVRPLLKQVTQKIAQVCGVDSCAINLLQDGRVVPLMAQFADGHVEPEMWQRYISMEPLEAGACPPVAQVITTRAPLVVDMTDETRVPRWWVDRFGVRTSVFVPLVRQDTVSGILHLNARDAGRRFAPWQIDVAVAIAGQLAFAVDNARLYGELHDRLRETTTLLAVGRALSLSVPMVDAMRAVAREVGRALGAGTVGAYLLDARRDELVPLVGHNVPDHLREVLARHPISVARFPAFREAVSSGRAMWSPDAGADLRFDQEWEARLDPHSVLFVPTIVRGRVFGGLFLAWWFTGRQFRPAEIGLLEAVAYQVGLAMENVELARRTEQKLRETETLLDVSRSLTSPLELPGLLRQFLKHVQQTLGSDSVGVWLRDDDSATLKPIAGYRVPPERLDAIRQLRLACAGHPFYAEAFRAKRPAASYDDVDDTPMPDSLREVLRHRTKLLVPIVAKDAVIGAFIPVWWTARREFTEEELQLMESIAGQAGAAIENARLFADNQRRLEELSLLYELSRAVTGQLDRRALVETIYRQLSRVLDAPIADIVAYDEIRQEFEILLLVTNGVLQRAAAGRRYPLGVGLMSRVVERRAPIRVDDYAAACRREGVEAVDDQLPERFWLGAPMIAGNEVVGVLGLRRSARPWAEADERLLENIAGLAALAFRSSRLYEERTRAYSELVAAQDHLVRMGKLQALGEMASGVAHGFNNLLMSILGRTQMLLQHVQDPRLRDWLQVIERASLDGAQTVRRLQEFTRIRRDQAFVPVDLNQVVREAVEVTQFRWRDEGATGGVPLEVVTRYGQLAYISGDPVELREALTNLILNAVDAMPLGGILSVTTRVDGDRVEVTVGDTGEGMDDEVKKRLFEPFFTTKGTRGMGLGLSMTFGIISRHAGQIEVDSMPGKGTRIHLRLPVAWDVARELPDSRRDEATTAVEPVHCLVVDDEEAVREMLGDLLVIGGHTVVLASTGEEAIERLRSERFDVVLTDLGMPKVSGWEVARACKALSPKVPVVLVTGWGVELSQEELEANGVDAVLSKPLNVDRILDAVAAFHRQE